MLLFSIPYTALWSTFAVLNVLYKLNLLTIIVTVIYFLYTCVNDVNKL